MEARRWRSQYILIASLAFGSIAACDEPDAADLADEALDVPGAAAHGEEQGKGPDEAPGKGHGECDDPSGPGKSKPKKPRCCFALCESTGAYFQVGYEKQGCEQDAAAFCTLYAQFDPEVGPLVNAEWLVCE